MAISIILSGLPKNMTGNRKENYMNKFNRIESKKIKAIVRSDPFGRITYKQARKLYKSGYIWQWDPPEWKGE